jgi:hypothetical protein
MRRNPNTGQFSPDPGGLLLRKKRHRYQQKTSIGFFGFLWNVLLILVVIYAIVSNLQ